MTKILWAGSDQNTDRFCPTLRTALEAQMPGAQLVIGDHDPAEIDYLVYAPNGPVQDFTAFTSLKMIQSLWAGVDVILSIPDFPDIPLARMADTGMAEGMADYVVTHALMHHLGTSKLKDVTTETWAQFSAPPLTRTRKIAILGLGTLGQFCAKRLLAQGFQVLGWSRSQKHIDGVTCYDGPDGLKQILGEGDTFVLLLPNTKDTENLINSETLAAMKTGATIINAGRGGAIDDHALIASVQSGQIAQATLDVFRTEPLPRDHGFWDEPNIVITPHIAADTRVETACEFAAENIRRFEAAEPVIALVDRRRGY
ncbi:MAG: glyoxylate/hydroxypyruvate reductase A [Pseudomonadota bacterium]